MVQIYANWIISVIAKYERTRDSSIFYGSWSVIFGETSNFQKCNFFYKFIVHKKKQKKNKHVGPHLKNIKLC